VPNILKRPMFRRGGSAAKGTGITSGLERQNYQDGDLVSPGRILGPIKPSGTITPGVPPVSTQGTITDISEELIKKPLETTRVMPRPEKESPPRTPGELEQQIKIINQMKERFQPTGTDVMDDTMAAIASTTPDDPTKLQTFGQFLGKAGTAATGLRRQRQEAVDKFEKDATLQVLKNLNEDEKNQLFRYANERARILKIPEGQRTARDEQRLIFLERFLRGSTVDKTMTNERIAYDQYKQMTQSEASPYYGRDREANNISKTRALIINEQAPNANTPDNPDTNFSDLDTYKDLRPGKYIDPQTGHIYRIDTQGEEATKVWPK